MSQVDERLEGKSLLIDVEGADGKVKKKYVSRTKTNGFPRKSASH